jgi:hypothetical protein
MDTRIELLENKARIKMNELRIRALINLLSKEGIITHEEVENEIALINKQKDVKNG